MVLVLSTLPHFFTAMPLMQFYQYTSGHVHVIFVSTTFSILYHATAESHHVIRVIDYCVAFLWFLHELYNGYRFTQRSMSKILISNLLVFLINLNIPSSSSYRVYHSLWHILNASKSMYVSSVIAKGLTKREDSGVHMV
jgi:hypothetical protein